MRTLRIFSAIIVFLVMGTSLQCSSSSGGAGLEWDEVVEDINGDPESIFAYRVHYGTASGEYTDFLAVENSTTVDFSDLTLEPDTLYYFTVTAVDLAGNESDVSNEVEVQTPPAS